MDPIALVFYAVICGLLSLFAPSLGGMVPRLALGAVVGIVAAALLPTLKALIGG
ncbi:hypothetical protein [Thalassobius sp. MITS945101]|uniref:hypothetical protein n=1 Tax=Thalassobius sp. MITS945101 TaxID=3096994 RepID=UPI00399B30E7